MSSADLHIPISLQHAGLANRVTILIFTFLFYNTRCFEPGRGRRTKSNSFGVTCFSYSNIQSPENENVKTFAETLSSIVDVSREILLLSLLSDSEQ